MVKGHAVKVGAQMRYLGLVLDGRWAFTAHFAQLAPRLTAAAAALGRLLPNVGGPGSPCRRLYAGILRSMALYGAPVWVDALTARNVALLRKPQRVMAVRAVRGYRTVSWTAGTLLAGDPPWALQAEALAEVYRFRAGLKERGIVPRELEISRIRALAHQALIRRWEEELRFPAAGLATVEAIRPHLSRWIERQHGMLTYRLTQMLTGHGCFGKYLHQVAGREATPVCHGCGAAVDTAHHTLAECVVWAPQRRTLVAVLGGELSLSTVVRKCVDSESGWSAFASFCETVISQKEADERERERSAPAGSLRGERPGRRRRGFAALLHPA